MAYGLALAPPRCATLKTRSVVERDYGRGETRGARTRRPRVLDTHVRLHIRVRGPGRQRPASSLVARSTYNDLTSPSQATSRGAVWIP